MADEINDVVSPGIGGTIAIQSATAGYSKTASTTEATFTMKVCRYCRSQWELGAPANHQPGCPNVSAER